MPVLDNPKWELAAQEVAKGRTQLAAIKSAGYAPHDSNASRLIGNDRVKLRIPHSTFPARQRDEVIE